MGRRSVQWRAISGSMLRATCAISPSGLRTATAQLRGPRIITPSRTACPPTFCVMRLRGALSALGLLEAPLEALDPAARVDELLLAGVERMAGRAHLDVQLGLRGTRRERVSAAAMHGGEDVIGMDLGLHGRARIAAAVWPATLPPETRSTGFSASILPASQAAVAAAPAGSTASLAR